MPLSRFEQVSKHILREAELEYDWVIAKVGDGAGETEIAQRVSEFHALLDVDNNRDLLRQEGGESKLRRTIRAAMRESSEQ